MMIDRCICTNRSFAELLKLARRKGYDVSGLIAATHAGGGCAMCRPYLEQTLETEQTEFCELLGELQQIAPAERAPGNAPDSPCRIVRAP